MMEWTHIIQLIIVMATILGSTIPLFIRMDYKLEEHRRESEEHRRENRDIILSIQLEMKDFHGRLCAIEERNKK